jgi:beta-fructofuranosidase
VTEERPRFHFTPERGWINDPHGIVWTGGEYHVFSQAVPHATEWRQDVSWGHAAGPDLLSLRHLPVAIAPGDGDDGVWTGCVVRDGDGFRAFYTAVTDGRLGLARVRTARTTDPGLGDWTKGPVVLDPPPGTTAFRDPVVRREGDRWTMTVGAELDGDTAAALVWDSDDLLDWRPRGIAASRPSTAVDPWTGTLWECPQLVDVDDGRQVLVTSVWTENVSYDTAWAIGTWQDDRFAADAWYPLSTGLVHYAPSAFRDAEGRPCLLFWLRGVRGDGWMGAHSLPFVIGTEGDRPTLALHPDVLRYAGPPVRVHDDGTATVPGSAALARWSPSDGDSLEVAGCRLDAHEGAVSLAGGGSPDGGRTLAWDGGPVDVVVDGPIVEVVVASGVTAAVVAPLDEVVFRARGSLTVRELARSHGSAVPAGPDRRFATPGAPPWD